MKRILSIILSLLLLFTAVPFAALAAEGPAFVASAAQGLPGEMVQITISTENNPGICSLKIDVGFDANVLELVSTVGATAFPGAIFGQTLTTNPHPINWVNSMSNNNNNGTIATFTFKIKEGAPVGDYPITLEYLPDNVYNFDWDNVYFDTVAGKVTVLSCQHTNTTKVPAKEPSCTEEGNEEYYVCDACGAVTSGSAEKLPVVPHAYDNNCDADCNVCGGTREVGDHVYDNACDAACNECGATRTPADHVYDNNCDADCNVCGATRKPANHVYDNACDTDCNECGKTRTVGDHVYANNCDADCNECGATRTPADHVYENACDADCNECGATRVPADHVYDNDCDASCNVCGATRTPADHVYDNVCDTTCNECGATRTVPHVYSNNCDDTCNTEGCGATRVPADHVYDHACDNTCNECGATRTTSHVYDNECDGTCNTVGCGATRTPADHVYNDVCDTTCNECGDTRTVSHVYSNNCDATCNTEGCGFTRTPSAHVYDHACDTDCNECGDTRTTSHVYDNACDATCNTVGCGATRVPADHVYSNNCDATCNVCGGNRVPADHVYDNNCDATCNECGATRTPADHVYDNVCDTTCNECGATRTVPHVYTNNCDDTCNTEGCGATRVPADHVYDNTCDTTCNECGAVREITHTWDSKWTTDEGSHWHACSVCGATKDKADHEGGNATCQKQSECSVCSAPYGTLAVHTFYAETVADKYLKAKATCASKAVYYKSCTMCGLETLLETFETGEFDANNHVGETELKDDAEATCEKEGYTGDTYCMSCNAKVATGEVIEKEPHVINEWVVSKEPTTTENGEKTGTCETCNKDFIVQTGKLVEEFKEEKVEASENLEGSVTIEIVGETNITEDVIFVADEILDVMKEETKEEVVTAIEKLEEKVKDHKLAAVFDLKLILRETTTDGDKVNEKELELEGKVKVSVPVPTVVLETFENLKLIHVKDDGSVEFVDFTLNGTIATFEATGFSYYTFVGTEKQVVEQPDNTPEEEGGNTPEPDENVPDTTPEGDKTPEEDKTPTDDGNKEDNKEDGKTETDTGDHSSLLLFVILALASLLGMAGVTVALRRTRKVK